MSFTKRLVIAVGLLLLDGILYFLPLTAIFLAYIILVNPPWFREFLNSSQ